MLSPLPACDLRLLAMLGEQPIAAKPQALGLMAVICSFLASFKVLVILSTIPVPFLTFCFLAACRVIRLREPAAKSTPRSLPDEANDVQNTGSRHVQTITCYVLGTLAALSGLCKTDLLV